MNVYIIPGLVVGCVYAIAASGIVLTYATSGVLNLAYGAIAFFNASFFFYLTGRGWNGWLAAALLVFVFSPLLGIVLWRGLFRFMVGLSLVPALISSIGLAVALPALADMVFRPDQVFYARGVITPGLTVHRFGSIAISTDQMSAVVGAIAIAAALFVLLRYTKTGLRMRAVFDNPPITALTGVSPNRISTISWALTTSLAGLGGILLAPLLQLTADAFLSLTVASLAAALVGGLRSIAITFAAAIGIGVLSSTVAAMNTGNGLLALGIQPSLPFIVMAVTLFLRRRALFAGQPGRIMRMVPIGRHPLWRTVPKLWPVVLIMVLSPILLNEYWTGVVGLGFVYGLIFLSFTVTLGDAGMIPLGQAAIVGIGGFTTGMLVAKSSLPLLASVPLGGLTAMAAGALVAYAGGRLGTLEFGFLTLAGALFCTNFLFRWTTFVPVSGTDFPSPHFFGHALSTDDELYLFGICLVIGLLLFWAFHRRIAAFVVNAGRMNVAVAEATGINPRNGRVLANALGCFFAGVGGALLGIFQLHLGSDDVSAGTGLLWLAVVVLMGIRTPAGAVIGGMAVSVMPSLLQLVLPLRWGTVPTLLFGLGGLGLAADPRGVVSQYKDFGSKIKARLSRPVQTSAEAAAQ